MENIIILPSVNFPDKFAYLYYLLRIKFNITEENIVLPGIVKWGLLLVFSKFLAALLANMWKYFQIGRYHDTFTNQHWRRHEGKKVSWPKTISRWGKEQVMKYPQSERLLAHSHNHSNHRILAAMATIISVATLVTKLFIYVSRRHGKLL